MIKQNREHFVVIKLKRVISGLCLQ